MRFDTRMIKRIGQMIPPPPSSSPTAPASRAPHAGREEPEEKGGAVVEGHLLEVQRQGEENAAEEFCTKKQRN